MFTIEPKYAYLFLTTPFVFLWIVIFLLNKENYSRKKQIIVSSFFAIIGPISELAYFSDYWHPLSVWSGNLFSVPILLEDVLFGFAFGGIASVLFELLSKDKVFVAVKQNYIFFRIFITDMLPFAAFLLFWFIGINSIFATAFAALFGTAIIICQRKDLVKNALGSGFIVAATMFLCYEIVFTLTANQEMLLVRGWFIHGTSFDVRFLGIPLTELFWGFAFGTFISPWYEYNFSLSNKERV
ncbi:MAG: lycopene cyclase domain-containing protein [Candidatus Parcubacteria bacterium]|nr:lycopene cyclase domain-containing protein [Candidatus Parcubacteria bacterium]